MDEPYIGEIRPIGYNYAPQGWAFCNGQILPIAQNQALFALLGTTFGGNGTTTFALPDLRGRLPVGTGQLPGGSTYTSGQTGGVEGVTLVTSQLPPHTHQVSGTLPSSDFAETPDPNGAALASGPVSQFSNGTANATMGATANGTTANTGSSQAHDNRQPYLGLNYVIALQGIFPSRP